MHHSKIVKMSSIFFISFIYFVDNADPHAGQIVESGVQLFLRLNNSSQTLKDINPRLLGPGTPVSNQIIEVTGDFSNELLLDFIIRCTLPQELNAQWKGSGVVFVNTNHHLNILKITNVLDAHLKNLNVKCRKPVIESALSHITILNCYNDEQLEMTFRNLEKIIQDRDDVSLLVVDDITSQFWLAKQKNVMLSLEQYSKLKFQLLQNIVKDLNVVLIFSRYQLRDLKKTVDLHVDYKIIGETLDADTNQFTVIDYVRKSSNIVPFKLEMFITFL
jgi:hypothetical protein